MEDENLPAPGWGEIGRSVIKVEHSLSELRRDLAETYVRKDVWQQSETTAGIRVGEVIQDITDLKVTIEKLAGLREADRRLIFTALMGPIFSGLLVGLVIRALF